MHCEDFDWSTWLANLSSGLTIIGTGVAIFLAVRLWFPVPRVARLRSRKLGLTVRHRRRESIRENTSRIDKFLEGNERDVTHELTWLNSVKGGSEHSTLLDRLDHFDFEDLSRRYSDVAAAMLRANALDPGRPLMTEMAELHRNTAAELAVAANAEAIPNCDTYLPLNPPKKGQALKKYNLRAKHLTVELFAYPGCVPGHVVFDCLAHVNENELTGALPPRSSERYEDHTFDGVLPALNSARLQRDLRSGRVRLALSLRPVRYSDVERDHFFAQSQHELVQQSVDPLARVAKPRDSKHSDKGEIDGSQVGLLTCSFLPVTSDGYLLLVERGVSAGAHAGDVGPAATGNLELAPRNGNWVDRLPSGCPDFRLAMQREAKEELGLDIPVDSIFINALARFTSSSEINSNVLCATAMLQESLEDVAAGFRGSDIAEGRWEVGGHLVGIRLPAGSPRTEPDRQHYVSELRRLLSWLWTTADLPPHAAVNGWATVATALNIPEVFTEHLDQVAHDSDAQVTPRAMDSTEAFVTRIPLDKAWSDGASSSDSNRPESGNRE